MTKFDRFGFPEELGLTQMEGQLARLLVLQGKLGNREAYRALYVGARMPITKTVDQFIHHIRRKCAAQNFDLKIVTLYRWGWEAQSSDLPELQRCLRTQAANPKGVKR